MRSVQLVRHYNKSAVANMPPTNGAYKFKYAFSYKGGKKAVKVEASPAGKGPGGKGPPGKGAPKEETFIEKVEHVAEDLAGLV